MTPAATSSLRRTQQDQPTVSVCGNLKQRRDALTDRVKPKEPHIPEVSNDNIKENDT